MSIHHDHADTDHDDDTAPPSTPAQQLSIATADADDAARWLDDYFPGIHYDPDGPPRGDYLRARITTAAHTTTGRFHFGVQTAGQTAAMPTFATGLVLAGTAHLNPGGPRAAGGSDRHEQTFDAGEPYSWITGVGVGARYGAGAQFGWLAIPFQLLIDAAEATTGLPAASVRVLDMRAVSVVAGRYWAQLMAFTHRDLTSDHPTLTHPLIAQHWHQTLASAALNTFPNTTLTTDAGYLPGPGVTGPATVRRALAHAEAHAAEPIGIGDLARAAGIGVRALQLAYAQHVGCSPMAHLRQVRLRRAHAELVAASPRAGDGSGTTVAAVAARWGFTPGGFTNAYRAQYGQSPRLTLRS